MPDGNQRSRSEVLAAGFFCVLFAFATGMLLYTLGVLNGREAERRQETPAAYSESAKAAAQRACAGREPSAVFECVYEHTKASQEQAYADQDLSAQQRAATSALAAAVIAFLTLVVTGIGVWFVKRTLEATLEAVEDTSIATEAMKEANKIARDNSHRQLRAYLTVKGVTFDECPLDDDRFQLLLEIQNNGQTPATMKKVVLIAQWVSEKRGVTIVSQDGPIEFHVHRDTPMHMPFSFEAEFEGYDDPGHLLVFGRLEFEDVFGKTHKEPISFRTATEDFVPLHEHEFGRSLAAYPLKTVLAAVTRFNKGKKDEAGL